MKPLDSVLRPRAIAVVGASSDPRKRGHQAIRTLQASGYPGAIYPVHPRGGELLGLSVVSSLEALPGPTDLALVCTPADSAPTVVAACGRAGIAVAVLVAVGFRESGPEGQALEAATTAAAREYGVRLVGPNTSGLANLPVGLNLIGVRGVPAGRLGLLVQSGNLALNLMLDAARRSQEGISICVGVGNEADLGFADFLDELAHDEATHAVLVHVEGFRRGAAALAAAARAARIKPIVLLKAVRAQASEAAARSHTGAVAGSYAVLRAALRQAGVTLVHRSDELFHVGQTLASQPSAPPGSGVAILSDGGGQGTCAVDGLHDLGTPLAELGPSTRARLRALLGAAAATANPVDLAGAADADPRRFADVLDLLLDDPAVGATLVVGLFGGYGARFDDSLTPLEVEAAERMAGAARRAGRPLVVHTMYAPSDTLPLTSLRRARVPVIESLEVACRCVDALIERGLALATPPWQPKGRAPARGRRDPAALSEPEARDLLRAAGLRLVPATFAADADAAIAAAHGFDGPVALKVVADGITHKTDAGGVCLDLEGDHAVRQAFDRVAVGAAAHGGVLRGVLVSPMVPAPIAELLVGARHDEQYGPLVSVGAGGIRVEVHADVALRLLPLRPGDGDAMLDELRIAPILRGARGAPPVDRAALVAVIETMAHLLVREHHVVEAEINPLFAFSDRVVAVDARVFVR